MIAVQGVLGIENSIDLPEPLRDHWAIESTNCLYAEMKSQNLILAKDRRANTVATILLTAEKSIILPKEFVRILGVQTGDRVYLSLKDDIVTIYGSNIIDLDLPAHNIDRLAKKIKREYDTVQKSPIRAGGRAWIDDVYHFLLLESWDDDVISRLLSKPNILAEIVCKIQNDDEFECFLEKKMREKIIECGREGD